VRAADSSALVKYYAREPGWERVRKVVLEGVITLELAVIEVANALWKKVLRSKMSFDLVREIVEDLTIRKASMKLLRFSYRFMCFDATLLLLLLRAPSFHTVALLRAGTSPMGIGLLSHPYTLSQSS
jgi:hypothetical protein